MPLTHPSQLRHHKIGNYRIVVDTLTRKVRESDDGVMIARFVLIDGEHFNEWECKTCGEVGQAPAISNPHGSHAESQWFLSWIRQHYPYHENHISKDGWYKFVQMAIDTAEEQQGDHPHDDFGQPFVMCLNTPCRDELAYAETNGLEAWRGQERKKFTETNGRETESSGTISSHLIPAPPLPKTLKGPATMTDVTNSVTFHNVDSDTYARLLAVANGSAPAAVGSEKPAKEKKSKPEAEPETTPADDFEADQADERKTYTEKALTKLVDKKDRDGLAAIAETYGLDIKGKRAGTLKDMILAAQIEAKEQAASDDGKPDAKDADDYAEDEPAASKKGKKAKSDKKGKKGSKK